jgi:hypothetical protein
MAITRFTADDIVSAKDIFTLCPYAEGPDIVAVPDAYFSFDTHSIYTKHP